MPMVNPFMGAISITGFSWAPANWTKCDGQQLQINQYQAVYALLGSQFGGDDRTYFNVPDLRGRAPLGWGTYQDIHTHTYNIGNFGGYENVQLTAATTPTHTHDLVCTASNGTKPAPNGRGFAIANQSGGPVNVYGPASNLTQLSPAALPTPVGGSQPHNNIQPSIVLNFVLSLDGIFPPRN